MGRATIRKTQNVGKTEMLLRAVLVTSAIFTPLPALIPAGPHLPRRTDEEVGNRHARRREAKRKRT